MSMSEMNDEQLVHSTLSLERELLSTRFQHSAGNLENTSTLRVLRRGIARLKTEQRTRELAAGTAHGSLMASHGSSFVPGTMVAEEGGSADDKGGFLKGIVDKLKTNE